MLPMDACEIFGAVGHNLEHVIRRSRHKMAFQDLRDTLHLGLEGVQDFIRLTLQFDLDKMVEGRPIVRGSSRAT